MKTYSISKHLFVALCASFFSLSSLAQAPSGYYDQATDKTSYALKTSLYFIIDNHNDRGYAALWDLYPIADKGSDGFLWDIYSDCDLTFGTDQDNGSGGTVECDKYNREHTFPQSWFNSISTPRADAHMVMPTDKKINSERGNLPYGETNGSVISSNGAKKGTNIINGYSGTIFEPADEYKGDIARIYFYMATRYEAQIDGWETNSTEAGIVLNGTENQVYEDWVITMLLTWHHNDPVSQKEIDRNEAVFEFQGNRNPFVDHPEWVTCIWSSACGSDPIPQLESNLSTINFGEYAYGSQKITKVISLTGSDLTAAVNISLNSEDFLISTSPNSNFGSTLEISPDATGNIQQSIYILLDPKDNLDEQINASITITQSEVADLAVQLSANIIQVVGSDIQLNFLYDTLIATVENPTYELTIQANKKVDAPLQIALKLASFENIFYPAQFSTNLQGTGTSVHLMMEIGDSLSSFLINLDTAQLKTASKKSFNISLVENGNYFLGEDDTFFFLLEGFDVPITSNRNKELGSNILQQNPVENYLYFKEKLSNIHYLVIDKNGQLVQQNSALVVQAIDVRTLSSGLYYLIVIRADDGSRSINKFIKH